jgi:2'-hydroxyisoflavone reductase
VRLLILGGTKFLGRATAEAAIRRGHELALFTRGRTNPELFPEAEKLIGDRDGDLTALAGRSWDAVVDLSGFVPRLVSQSVEAVDAPYYLFVSSRSVYSDYSRPTDEAGPVHGDVDSEDVSKHYGELKAMCERVARRGPGAIVRPGLIVGPHDPTGRFTYWPYRLARGGDVLAPGAPDDPVTLIDVRDLGKWLVRLCEERTDGIFNAVDVKTWGDMLDACLRVTASKARLVWVPSDWLLERGVGEWMELPLWIASPGHEYFHRVPNDAAASAGLTFRPLDETARATLEAAHTTEEAGLNPAREEELLRAWREHRDESS